MCMKESSIDEVLYEYFIVEWTFRTFFQTLDLSSQCLESLRSLNSTK